MFWDLLDHLLSGRLEPKQVGKTKEQDIGEERVSGQRKKG
jgi:hypothetical protein